MLIVFSHLQAIVNIVHAKRIPFVKSYDIDYNKHPTNQLNERMILNGIVRYRDLMSAYLYKQMDCPAFAIAN